MSNEPRQERAIRTREQILTGAVEVLVEHGYAGMTMQRVQSAAGVSRGALTHHFGSMTQIAVAAVDFIAENQSAEIRGAIAPETSMLDAVEVIHEITAAELCALIPTLASGMVPKMEACLRAVQGGVGAAHVIDGRVEHSVLLEILTEGGIGTMVTEGDHEKRSAAGANS